MEERASESDRAEELPKANILLVDDLPEKLLAMESVLSELGQNLVRATSGKEALRLLLKQEFAVILLDVNMPGMDGFETATLIRQRRNSETTPIIFITSVGGGEIQEEKGYALGAVDYIFSPIVPEVLKTKVRVFTELYRKTQQIKRMNAELEEKIRERTVQLEEANQALTRLNRIKSDFISMVSHELRTPLTSIKGGIDIILDGIEGEISRSQGEVLQIAKNNVDRLARLIDNVLNFNRMEAGRLEVFFQPTDLGILVEETCRLMEMEAARKDIGIRVEVAPNQNTIAVCDGDKIRQVLINLIHNAVKFTESQGKITVRLKRESGRILIAVEDTGMGIAPEDQKKIFEIFEQGTDLKKRAGGVGLGLMIVKKYMELHSGEIRLESEVGKGSTFVLILPVKPVRGV